MAKTMKERVADQGGLFSCAWTAQNGRRSSRCLVRAHSAQEAKIKIAKAIDCALVALFDFGVGRSAGAEGGTTWGSSLRPGR